MAIPANVRDLEYRFRPLTEDEQTVASVLLEDAWAVLQTLVPGLDAAVTAGVVSDGAARSVLTAMVLRVLRNPNGVRSWSVDDYSETRDNAVSAGSLYATPDEIALLRVSSGRSGAFSVAPPARVCPAPGAERDAAELEWLRYGRYGYGGYQPYPCP